MNTKRWKEFSLAQQLGHIGSAVARARHWEEKGDLQSRDKALEEALALMDLTLADRRNIFRLKELLRLREIISNWFLRETVYDSSPESIEDYCTIMALAARKSK